MKTYNWLLIACFAGALASIPGYAQQNLVHEFRGEIRKSPRTIFRGLVVELAGIGAQGDSQRSDVQSDGSFSFRNVPGGEYALRVTNYQGDVLQQDFISVSPQNSTVTLQLREPDAPRPPAGTISVARLQHPPSPKAFQAFVDAQHLSEAGNYEKAALKLKDAVRISPDYSDAWTNLAAQHIRLRRFDDAISEATRALEIAGPNSVDLCNLAMAQWATRRFPEALTSALRGAELDPASAKAQYLAGAMLADSSRWDEALPRLQFAARSMEAAKRLLDQAPSKLRQSLLPRVE